MKSETESVRKVREVRLGKGDDSRVNGVGMEYAVMKSCVTRGIGSDSTSSACFDSSFDSSVDGAAGAADGANSAELTAAGVAMPAPETVGIRVGGSTGHIY